MIFKKRYKIHIIPSFKASILTHPIAIYHIFRVSCKNTQKRNHIFNKIRKKILTLLSYPFFHFPCYTIKTIKQERLTALTTT